MIYNHEIHFWEIWTMKGYISVLVTLNLVCNMEIMLNFSNGLVELLWLYSKVHNMYIAIIYRQPDDRIGNHRSTEKKFQPEIFLLFLIQVLTYSSACISVSGGSTSEQLMIQQVQQLQNDYFLQQFITSPIHVGGMLDLVFCNNPAIIQLQYTPPTSLHLWSLCCRSEYSTHVQCCWWGNRTSTTYRYPW